MSTKSTPPAEAPVVPGSSVPLSVVKAELFKALSHPVRIRILELLRTGEMTVSELQSRLELEASSVSQQLGVLRSRQLVAGRKAGTSVHYRVVDPQVFDAVQRLLATHRRSRDEKKRQGSGALLQGLLCCRACQRAMTPAHCWNRTRRYRYYVCTRAQKEGWSHCAHPSVPAGRMEALVIEQVRELACRQAPGLEAVAQSNPHPKLFQLYVRGDASWVDDYVARAIAERYVALCLTVDLDYYGRRERDIAKRYLTTARRRTTSEEYQARFAWSDVDRIKSKFKIPIILKGIATAADARIAVEHGIE